MIVLTAITNNRTTLKEIPVKYPGVDYVCYTDDINLRSDTWEIRYEKDFFHKLPKIFAHIYGYGHDYSLWIDGSVILKCNPYDLVPYLDGNHIATFNARDRQCSYEEAIICKRLKLDDSNIIDLQVDMMKRDDYPEQNGLSACTIILRDDNTDLYDFNRLWFNMIDTFSERDQISYNYCLWKTGVKQSFIPGSIFDNKFVKWN